MTGKRPVPFDPGPRHPDRHPAPRGVSGFFPRRKRRCNRENRV